MNLNHMFLCLLGVVFLCAVAYAQVPFAGFQCDKGVCVTDEKTVDRIQEVINRLVEIIRDQEEKLKGVCT
jgi:hypothetical protein